MEIGDLLDDGYDDVIFSETDFDNIFILNNSGSQMMIYNIGEGDIQYYLGISTGMDIGDINNDGVNDIAVSSYNGYVHILQYVSCVADFNDSTSYNMTWNFTNKK